MPSRRIDERRGRVPRLDEPRKWDLQSLRQLRAENVRAMETILDVAEEQKRDLTKPEVEQFDRLADEVRGYEAEIEERERELEAFQRQALGDDARGGSLRFRTAEGREVPGYLAGERLADAYRRDPAPWEPQGDLSVGRFVLAAISGDWRHAEAEYEAMRAMQTTTGAEGGFLVPDVLSAMLIDEARSRSVLVPAGAITVPMESQSMDIARVTGSPSAEFRAFGEELTTLPSTGVTLGRVSLRAKTLGATVDISEELAQDAAAGGAEALVESLLVDAVASQLDRAFLRGQLPSDDDTAAERLKGGQPGVLDDPEILEITGVGSLHWDDIVDAITRVAEQNGSANSLLLTPRDMGTLEKLKDATSGLYLRPPDAAASLRRFVTTQLPNVSGTTEALVGNLTSAFVILGVRSQFRIEVSRTAGDSFERYGAKVRIVGRYDINVGRPTHLVALRGITA